MDDTKFCYQLTVTTTKFTDLRSDWLSAALIPVSLSM